MLLLQWPRNVLGALLAIVVLAGCEKVADSEYKATQYVFGTLVEFTIRGVDAKVAEDAVAAIGHDFQHMHKDWHAWKPGEMSDLNRAFAAGEGRDVSPFLLPLIKQAKVLYERSDGLFNPAIGGLIGMWGFHADELPVGTKPDLDAVRALAAKAPAMDDVVIDGSHVSSRNRAVELDFGGFAKGVALDRAVARLRALGVKDAIVNAGGDLNTIGSHGDRPWKVGIRHPKNWGVVASVDLAGDEVMYTSGNYERYREDDGIRRGHIINPKTGMPVDHIVSSSVIGREGWLADAAATALSVAGPDGWYAIAKRMGVKYALLVDDQGTIYMDPAMAARVVFPDGAHPRVVISGPL